MWTDLNYSSISSLPLPLHEEERQFYPDSFRCSTIFPFTLWALFKCIKGCREGQMDGGQTGKWEREWCDWTVQSERQMSWHVVRLSSASLTLYTFSALFVSYQFIKPFLSFTLSLTLRKLIGLIWWSSSCVQLNLWTLLVHSLERNGRSGKNDQRVKRETECVILRWFHAGKKGKMLGGERNENQERERKWRFLIWWLPVGDF